MSARDRIRKTDRVDPGAILKQSLAIVARNALQFSALTLLAFAPVIVYFGWLIAITLGEMRQSQLWLNANLLPIQIVEVAITLLATWTLSGMLVYGVYQHMRQRPVRIGDCVTVGLRRLPAVFGTALVVAAATGLGTAACVFPGVFLACMLWVALPVTVIENVGPIRACDRSSKLTTGMRGSIFAILFVMGGANWLTNFALGKVFDHTSPAQLGTELFLRLFVMLLYSMWTATAPAVGYYEIRRMREGLEVEDLAAVFD